MEDHPAGAMRHEERRLGNGTFNSLAALLAFAAYFAVFLFTGKGGVLRAAETSLRNLVPLAILSVAAQALISRFVIGRSMAAQVTCHVLLATAFTLLLYWMLMVLIGLSVGQSFTEFVVKAFFPTGAFAWQLLQGLTLYALVACLTQLRRPIAPSTPPIPSSVDASSSEPSPSRYFIRRGEDIEPIEIAGIISIKGADDYAEVATLNGSHLVRMTLAEFEKVLDGARFLRTHRSHIVNVDRIERAEPAGGGRMMLYMENGERIPASRAGTRLLRSRVI
jgi:hypothetical protein